MVVCGYIIVQFIQCMHQELEQIHKNLVNVVAYRICMRERLFANTLTCFPLLHSFVCLALLSVSFLCIFLADLKLFRRAMMQQPFGAHSNCIEVLKTAKMI